MALTIVGLDPAAVIDRSVTLMPSGHVGSQANAG